MLDIKALFGDKETLTPDELEAALDGMKLADLSEGGYVSKEKFEAEAKKRKEAEKVLADYEATIDGDEGLKKQVEALNAKLELAERKASEASEQLSRKERMDLALSRIKDAKLAKLAVIEAEALLSDDVDFDEALNRVIKDDPDYAPKDDPKPPARVMDSGKEDKGGAPDPDPMFAAFESGMTATKPKGADNG